MDMIEGAELTSYAHISEPQNLLNEILSNVRKAYLEVGVIHADLSEFNIIINRYLYGMSIEITISRWT